MVMVLLRSSCVGAEYNEQQLILVLNTVTVAFFSAVPLSSHVQRPGEASVEGKEHA